MTATQPIQSAAATRGELVLEAVDLRREFRLSRHHIVSAVHNVSFGLYREAVVALVGESGSGKSTVARLLAAQDRPTAGEIRLDGAPVTLRNRGRDFRRYKSDVQMVFQDPFSSLNPVHTVRYHLQRPVRIHKQAHGGQPEQQVIESLLDQVRLAPPEQYLSKFPHSLSGGQRQRVAIARALAAGPRVLLADEPVSMLDVSIRLEVLSLIDRLRAEFQLAVLYITHDIASARYLADETLVMYAGEVVESGPAEDVTTAPAHPYTQLLVSSAPDPLADRSQRRAVAPPGSRINATARTDVPGCRFAPRCPLATDHCREHSPPLVPLGPQRAAACWRLDVAAPALLNASEPDPV